MRRAFNLVLRSVALAAVVVPSASAAVPDFVPSPSAIYERFSALKEPRSELPVGALWIEGYGPVGDGASPDNLTTVKSLTAVALSRDLQLSLTAGLLSLLGIDPAYQSRVSARFGDLSIVQVKDPEKLSGPTGEPRIIEALRAGTITISTNSDVGLDINTGSRTQSLPVIGRGDSGRRKSWTIDGRDMFIAFRVATVKDVRGNEQDLPLQRTGSDIEAEIDDYRLVLDARDLERCICGAKSPEELSRCKGDKPVTVSVTKSQAAADAPAQGTVSNLFATNVAQPVALALPVPRADGKGGLFTSLAVRAELVFGSDEGAKSSQCVPKLGRKSRLLVSYRGMRVESLPNPDAPNW